MGKGSWTTLSRREREIMEVMYARGEATAAEVLGGLARPPSYSAVRALLRILEDKGQVRHREDKNRYIFSATMPREKAARGALDRLLATFFGGSLEKAVAAHLTGHAGEVSEEELRQLAELVRAAREAGRDHGGTETRRTKEESHGES